MAVEECATCAFASGHYQDAIKLWNDALMGFRQERDLDGELRTTRLLVFAYIVTGDFNRAESTLKILQQLVDEGDPDATSVKTDLDALMASLARARNKERSAERDLQENLRMLHEIGSPIGIAHGKLALGRYYYRIGRKNDAEPYLRQGIDALGSALPQVVSDEMGLLADFYESVRRFDEADQLHERRIEGLRRVDAAGKAPSLLVTALRDYARFLRIRGGEQEAARLEAEAERLERSGLVPCATTAHRPNG